MTRVSNSPIVFWYVGAARRPVKPTVTGRSGVAPKKLSACSTCSVDCGHSASTLRSGRRSRCRRTNSAPLRYGKISSSCSSNGAAAILADALRPRRISSRALSQLVVPLIRPGASATMPSYVACPSTTDCAAVRRSSSPRTFISESRSTYWSCSACTSSCVITTALDCASAPSTT